MTRCRRFSAILFLAALSGGADAAQSTGIGGEEIRQIQDYPGYCLKDWKGNVACADGSREPWRDVAPQQAVAQILAPATGGIDDPERRHRCGAALIAPDWVLTAASCIPKSAVADGYSIRIGAVGSGQNSTHPRGAILPITEVAFPPKYRAGAANAVALVRFREDPSVHVANPKNSPIGATPGRYVFPRGASVTVPPPGEPDIPFADVSASGRTGFSNGNSVLFRWSRIDNGPPQLAASPLFELPSELCDQQIAVKKIKSDNSVFCALSHDRPVCPSDIGAPVMGGHGELLVVAVTTGPRDKCAAAGEPGVFTLTSSYQRWIREVVKESYDKRKTESLRVAD